VIKVVHPARLLTQPRCGIASDAGPPGSAQAAGSVRRKLRVYIRSEHQHQQNAADAAEPPSWVLTVSGRIVGKDKVADKALDAGAWPAVVGRHATRSK
jgi:hypothetical protein